MSTVLLPFVATLVLLGVVAAVVVALLQAAKRRDELAAFAQSRGWTYARSDRRWVTHFRGAPFGRGHARNAENVLTGLHEGRQMVAFDYRYDETTGTGENRSTTTYRYSVVALSLGADLPALSVSPEGFFGRLVGRITGSDIELESEDFNRAFTVTCPDRKFAFDVLHQRTMEFLLQHRQTAWRFERGMLLMAERGTHSPDQVLARLGFMTALLGHVPEFVWREAQGR